MGMTGLNENEVDMWLQVRPSGPGIPSITADAAAFLGHVFGFQDFQKYKNVGVSVYTLTPKNILVISAKIPAYLEFLSNWLLCREP